MEPFSPVEAQPQAIEKAEEGAAALKPEPKIVGSKAFTPIQLGPERAQPGRQRGGRWRQLAAVVV